jgi:hypothetical protein
VAATDSFGTVSSNTATLTVNAAAGGPSIDVVTYHYDNLRSGQNINETTLTPANVNVTSFGKLGEFAVDGLVHAQPLGPPIGITSTPVIDRGRNAIYFVAMSKDSLGNYYQRIHALNLTTGTEMFGGPVTIQATFPGTGDNSSSGMVVFDPKQYKERAALLELGGVIYTTWASHCDFRPGAVNDAIKAFPIANGLLATGPSSQSTHTFGYPGATPSISASGTTNGIVWVVENSSPAVLHAYNATKSCH